MRANQTCPEWARLSGNKHCHYMSIRALMAFSHHCNNFVFIKLITNRFFIFVHAVCNSLLGTRTSYLYLAVREIVEFSQF